MAQRHVARERIPSASEAFTGESVERGDRQAAERTRRGLGIVRDRDRRREPRRAACQGDARADAAVGNIRDTVVQRAGHFRKLPDRGRKAQDRERLLRDGPVHALHGREAAGERGSEHIDRALNPCRSLHRSSFPPGRHISETLPGKPAQRGAACLWLPAIQWVARVAQWTRLSAPPGASAASFSSVAAPGGTEPPPSPKRTAANTAHTTHDGGMLSVLGHRSTNSGSAATASTIGVSTTPGSTRAMWTGSPRSSVRKASVSPTRANLVAQYPPSGETPRRPASEATLTMHPSRCAR